MDDLVQNLLKKYAIPGAVAGIARDGRLVFIRGYGQSDPQSGKGVDLDSQFRIASVTKPLTATAILKLVEEGRLALDDKVFSIIPPAVPVADPRTQQITVRNLLEHKGGWDREGTGYDPMFDDKAIATSLGTTLPIGCPDITRFMMGRRLDFIGDEEFLLQLRLLHPRTGDREEIRHRLRTVRSKPGAGAARHDPNPTRLQRGGQKTAFRGGYADYPGVRSSLPCSTAAPRWCRSRMAASVRRPCLPTAVGSVQPRTYCGFWPPPAARGRRLRCGILPPVSPADVSPADLDYTWQFNGSLPGTTAVTIVINGRDGHRTDVCVLMNSRPREGSNPVIDELTPGITGIISGVTDWPDFDLFRSRFDPSETVVELRYDGSASSTTVPVRVKGDSVAIDLATDPQAAWLTATAAGATAPTTLSLRVRDGALRPGSHETWVTVSSPRAENRFRVHVKLTVVPYQAAGKVLRKAGAREVPVPGVTIRFRATAGTGAVPVPVETGADGRWSQTGFELGTTYEATPSKGKHTFQPISRQFAKPENGLDFETAEEKSGDPKPKPDDKKSGLRIDKEPVTKDSDVYKKLVDKLGADAAQVLDHMIEAGGKPWVFNKAGDLQKAVEFRVLLMRAARELAAMNHGFSTVGAEADRLKSARWRTIDVRTDKGGSKGITNRNKTTPSDAVDEIYDPTRKGDPEKKSYVFRFDCANSQTAAYYRAVLASLGATEFNRRAGANIEISFRIWAGAYEHDPKTELVPGDGFSFDNPDADPDSSAANENAMYLGRETKRATGSSMPTPMV